MPPRKSAKRKTPPSGEKTPTELSETIDAAAEKNPAEEQREGSGKMFQHVCFSFWQDARDAPEAFGLHVVFIHVIYFLTESPARASKTGDASQASQATSSQEVHHHLRKSKHLLKKLRKAHRKAQKVD